MYKIIIGEETILSPEGELLSRVLIQNNKFTKHPCSGRGVCGKCKVIVDGKEVLSCQYRVNSDIIVTIPETGNVVSESGVAETGNITRNTCLALDIGTTTLALALISRDDNSVIKVVTRNNPQSVFGADVISRIDYCQNNSVLILKDIIVSEINSMIKELGSERFSAMYISGNTAMLHMFWGVDPVSLGVAPYKPVFLQSKKEKGKITGIPDVEYVETLPGIDAFIGADLVAGMNYIGLPTGGKYNLLVDLGTNAEIVLFSRDEALCTSAAAGPCFEGVNITCGMNATSGAVKSFSVDENNETHYETINNKTPEGICGTGLVDIIAELLKCGVIDETGYMECEKYNITEKVFLSQTDVRQYQLAKSAVYSGVISLINKAGISFEDIKTMYISGGFSGGINVEKAVYTGLLPKELKEKARTINNSSLLGTIKYACEKNDLDFFVKNSRYIDLSTEPSFMDLFLGNMDFSVT